MEGKAKARSGCCSVCLPYPDFAFYAAIRRKTTHGVRVLPDSTLKTDCFFGMLFAADLCRSFFYAQGRECV